MRLSRPFESFGRSPGTQRQAIYVSSLLLSILSLSRYYNIFPYFLLLPYASLFLFLCFFRLVSSRSLSGTKLCCDAQATLAGNPTSEPYGLEAGISIVLTSILFPVSSRRQAH